MGVAIQQREQDHDPKPTFIKVLPPVAAAAAAPRPSPMLRLISSLAIAAFLTTLLIFRFSLSFSFSPSADLPLELDFPLLNSTLADLAASDPSEDNLRRDISLLLQADFDRLSRSPPFLTWRRSFPPVDLASPSFRHLYRLHFLPLLSDWSSRRRSSRPEDSLSRLPALLGRYSSCAVVGNSGILLNSDHGAAIDSHAAVIRLNNAPIAPFPKHVGSKTTLSFVNSNILHFCARRRDCACHPYGPAVPVLLYLCQPLHLLDLATCNASSRVPFLVTPPAFDLLCAKIVKYYSLRRWFAGAGSRNRTLEGWFAAHDGLMFHYSSGMQAVMTAVGVCDRVSLFGFGKTATARHHYHTNQKGELDLHDYEAEYELYRDLAERPHAIPFLSGVQLPPVRIYH